MSINIKKIGMRNIKTAISVFLCIIISRILKMEYPFYAAIAAVITMQSSVVSTYKTGKQRMLGTLVGAAVGLMCSLIYPGSSIISGLGIIVIIYICNLLNWKESASIGCVVFLAIMLNLKGGSPLFYSLNRLWDTFLGIAIALAVNYFIANPES